MPTNNTENILSTPLTEGTGNPIPASRISYDNDNSHLTAEDAQEAVDELASSVGDLQEIVSGKLVQIGLGHTEAYVPTESETWAVKIGKLRTQMQAILEAIEDDERIRITEIILGNTVVPNMSASHLLTNGGSVYGDFAEINSNDSGYTVIRTVKVEVDATKNLYISTDINNSTSVMTVTDKSSTSNTTSVGFRYEIYKLIA